MVDDRSLTLRRQHINTRQTLVGSIVVGVRGELATLSSSISLPLGGCYLTVCGSFGGELQFVAGNINI